MKAQKPLIALTAINLGLLVFLLAQAIWPAGAEVAAPVLRGRALEIVDDQGRVRASIKVQPAGTAANGERYPETVMLRLIDANGRPSVKIGGSVRGAGLGLVGVTDSTQVLLSAEGTETFLRLTNRDGRQQLLKP